ncbi:apolipoprotein N-acyltransferase [Roseisolibacter agri]|uniref:Apolipoprotein N-acyltransferase n=1 Tax=Roseisolibacter agri TaxID=2014610 RepID=A0AA37VF59_9BACT|nr:apolipoprotein N-acyltransferase [Roseisolibacter agri]GLC26324.1 apolipoprotein N-acyltransferase [Roseisolibacter agri]
MFAVAFPPFDWLWPAIAAPAIVAVLVAKAAERDAPRRAVALAALFATVGYGANLLWLWRGLALVTWWAPVGFVFAALWHGLLFGAVVGGGGALLHRRWRVPPVGWLPVCWIAWETLLAHFGALRFPWLPLGLATAAWPTLVQAAELAGVSGLSAVLVLCAALLASAWRHRGQRVRGAVHAALAVGVLGALAGYGAWRAPRIPLRPLGRVAVVQQNMPQALKIRGGAEAQYVGVLTAMTRDLATRRDARPLGLVLWPETAMDGFLAEHPEWRDSLAVAARVARAPVLAGLVDLEVIGDGRFRMYNAATLVRADGTPAPGAPYRKQHLVPMLERVPLLADASDALYGAGSGLGGFSRGADARPITIAAGRVGALICFESVIPEAARRARAAGADLLAVLTNDAWFGVSAAPHQHAAHAVLRAVETRAAVVQAANSGPSLVVDARGRMSRATPLLATATPVFDVATSDVRTPWVRYGDWLGASSALLLALAVAERLVARMGRSAANPE